MKLGDKETVNIDSEYWVQWRTWGLLAPKIKCCPFPLLPPRPCPLLLPQPVAKVTCPRKCSSLQGADSSSLRPPNGYLAPWILWPSPCGPSWSLVTVTRGEEPRRSQDIQRCKGAGRSTSLGASSGPPVCGGVWVTILERTHSLRLPRPFPAFRLHSLGKAASHSRSHPRQPGRCVLLGFGSQ